MAGWDVPSARGLIAQSMMSTPASCIMRMQFDRDICSSLESLDKDLSVIGKKKSRHILDADGIGAHLLDLTGNVHPICLCISVTDRISKRDLGMSALRLRRSDGSFKVPQIVEAVKNSDPVNAVGDRLLYEILHYVVAVMAVAEKVLAAQQHLKRGLLKSGFKFSESVPRIFLEESKTGIESSSAPHLYSLIADLVHFIYDREHHFGGHSGRNE